MKTLLPLAAAASALLAGQAFAADAVYPHAPIITPPFVDNSTMWDGLYMGINLGYGFGEGIVTTPTTSIKRDIDGFLGGAQVGYNFNAGGFIIGAETDYQLANVKMSANNVDTGIESFGTIRARLGAEFNGFLPYITGGYAYGKAVSSVTAGGVTLGVSQWHNGWTIGAGAEMEVAENISAKLEYLYLDFGEKDIGLNQTVKANVHTVRLGVNFHF